MKIIALGCQKSVGKSSLAKFLITILRKRNSGLKIEQISFADGVKDVSFKVFGWMGLKHGEYYENHYNEKEIPLKCGLSPRDIWIAVGNKMREIDDKAWIESALANTTADIVIISDLRYLSEAITLTERKACLVRIHRDVPRGTDPAEVSLLDWLDWCQEIDNNGTLSDLYQKAGNLADYLETN
jgi:hypothetical protein